MKIVLAGGTGFVGKAVIQNFLTQGHEIILLSRNKSVTKQVLGSGSLETVQWDAKNQGAWSVYVNGADAIVNLAGESIASKRWSDLQKVRIVKSRLNSTRALVDAIAKASQKPSVLINASAVGYYGDVPEEEVVESRHKGHGFLADTCERWEKEAIRANDFKVRVVLLRLGVVLGKEGGALTKLLPPFRFFVGGPIGSGRQWFPWVHLDDVVGAINFAIQETSLRGPINVTAPEIVRMREFCSVLGKAMKRPSWAPVPAFALRSLLGEMAEMLLTGQRAVPQVLQNFKYPFIYPSLEKSISSLLHSQTN